VISIWLALVFFFSGIAALIYEVVWQRVLFAIYGLDIISVTVVVTAFMLGLGVGSLTGGAISRRFPHAAVPLFGVFEICIGLYGYKSLNLFSLAASATHGLGHTATGMVVFALLLVPTTLMGATLPMLVGYRASRSGNVGRSVGTLYFVNTLGAAVGACVAVESLLARFGASGSVAVSAALLFAAAAAAVAAAIAWSTPVLHERLYERLMYKNDFTPTVRFAQTFEGRAGVVNLTRGGAVYGGGSYDGQTNISPLPELDDNRVLRAYLVPAFHPHPRQILMVGLGAGAWLQVLANLDDVERITVVEINPGYVKIMAHTPALVSALANSKVEIVIDDGRRYLGHTERQFDVIIENTIVYWRAYAANLLSREYHELSRRHLAPGGVLYYNATYSVAAQRTGALTFPFALRYQNMIVASDSPVAIDRERFDQKLDRWEIDGLRVLPAGVPAVGLDLLRERPWRGVSTWEDRESILRRTEGEPVITDDNIANEWRDLTTFP